MSWLDWANLAIDAWGTKEASDSADKGTQANVQGQQSAIDEQRRQFDLTQQNFAPWLAAGSDALGKQTAFLNGDMSGFQNAPDYKYARSEGLDSIDNRAAARGGLFGGGNTRDAITFGSGLATQNADNYWNKLSGLSNTGQGSATNIGQFGANAANNIGNAYNNMGRARQSGYNTNANLWSNFGQNAVGGLNDWYANNSTKNGGGTGWYLGNNPGKG
jgi:hypothetical protein